MSLAVGLGPERNLLAETPEHCRMVSLEHPVLFENELQQLRGLDAFPASEVDCTFEFASSLEQAIVSVCDQAVVAAERGQQLLILSDRGVRASRIAIPMLMAVGAIHHRLSELGIRTRCSLLVDTSAVWGPHQLALLFGYGATAICPYLALHTAVALGNHEAEQSMLNFRIAIENGLRKIMAKMGISVLNSYQGAQIFEAIGIHREVIERCFRGTRSPIGGIGFDVLQRDFESLHQAAFTQGAEGQPDDLDHEGRYKPRKNGVRHLVNGHVTKSLHRFVKSDDASEYESFSAQVTPVEDPYSIRDLIELLPIEQSDLSSGIDEPLHSSSSDDNSPIESVESIRTRFTTAAMSLGAISPEAHEAIAIAMNAIGGKSNSGEGGEDPARWEPDDLGQDARSRIKQVASGRFGVTTEYLLSADEIEIKMAQGAKPGEGGQLPGFKVNGLIAKLRYTDPGVSLISPPPHHDIYSIEDLSQLIYDLKCVNPRATVCVKLVSKAGVGNIAVGVAKANADVILISGHEGGTGASPLSSINHAGIPWELGLAETHQALLENGLRGRVTLRVDGGLRNGRDVVVAAALGAEEFNFGTMALMSLGCVYVKKCHLNNCPVGIATQDPAFRKRFKGEPQHLIRYLNAVAGEVRSLLDSLNCKSLGQWIGRSDCLRKKRLDNHEKANQVELHRLFMQTAKQFTKLQPIGTPWPIQCFDDPLLDECQESIGTGRPVVLKRRVQNTDRNIGSRLAGQICQAGDLQSAVREPLRLELQGSAGQCLGAFLVAGMTIDLVGETNDYVGKSMSGGCIVIRPSESLIESSDEHVIMGNTCLYGATAGQVFAAGQAAERFAIRNSGAEAVIEGCGDHGCEYMTRGNVVILGSIGRNFGAGMTGGNVFVFDPQQTVSGNLNRASVTSTPLAETDFAELKTLIEAHAHHTQSRVAQRILQNWSALGQQFVKVVPLGDSSSAPPMSQAPAPHLRSATRESV